MVSPPRRAESIRGGTQASLRRGRYRSVRFERLVVEAGDQTLTLPIHPRLTVIANVGTLEREGLFSELVGALSSSRPGVHLELTEDDGRQLAVFRPQGSRHRVVDVAKGRDVSTSYMSSNGTIDLLARAGLDERTARRIMRLTGGDLAAASQGDHVISQLASVDPEALWAAAQQVRVAEQQLQKIAGDTGTSPEDAEVVERIEERHAQFVDAQQDHERTRRFSFFTAAFCVLGAVPLSLLEGRIIAMPFLMLSAVAAAISVLYWQRMERARRDESAVLAEAGATSYLGFHLQRVNGLVDDDKSKRSLMRAADAQRQAIAAWTALAGDISVDWAIAHYDRIQTAAQLHHGVNSLGAVSSTAPRVGHDLTNAIAHALLGRLGQVRQLGTQGESFPLVLDEPFHGLDPAVKPSLLELIGQATAHQQVILLTEDEDVASWARLEALTGALSIIEPSSEPSTSIDITV